MKSHARNFLIILHCVLSALFCFGQDAYSGSLPPAPLQGDKWYGIYVDNDRVGFYHQKSSTLPDGYIFEGSGVVRTKVLGFSKDSAFNESYDVSKNLSARSFRIEQSLNGQFFRVTGRLTDTSLRVRQEQNGRVNEKLFRLKAELIPASVLNIYPMVRDNMAAGNYKVQIFDSEELKVKEISISLLGEEASPDGKKAIKLRNNLYPFVHNDIWIDREGNTLYESVRGGLVITRPEEPDAIGAYVMNLLIARKDMVDNLALVPAAPLPKDRMKLQGGVFEITGWDDSIPLRRDGAEFIRKKGKNALIVKTGLAIEPDERSDGVKTYDSAFVHPSAMIESDASEILAAAKDISAKSGKDQGEIAKALVSWTSGYLKDTVDGNASALAAFRGRSGNAQAHARLFVALARSVGIPARYVTGITFVEGKGFVYHAWGESLVNGKWVAADPFYNQFPADPLHMALAGGESDADIAPLLSLVGRIRIEILDARY